MSSALFLQLEREAAPSGWRQLPGAGVSASALQKAPLGPKQVHSTERLKEHPVASAGILSVTSDRNLTPADLRKENVSARVTEKARSRP